ncbi:uncharacterized protein LOC112171547 [Rosa chinensis]|uniref:uncharacterized protein LOC112171547 n=1 Tax=Rosa chinensis TaxID=74649 RepID=UPI000D08AE12|nr:uncharacterized protein LOC112171547 [Rosa chinensis]
MDLDSTRQTEKPAALTYESTDEEKAFHKAWEKSNRLSFMLMRMTIANNIKTTLPKAEIAKKFLKNIEDRFKRADKSLAGTLIAELTTKKSNGRRSMHKHVVEMTNLAAKLKALGMNVDVFFLVQFILNSLPPQYEAFQINYNTIKDKWNVNELSSMLVQEEERLKQQEQNSIHLVGHGAERKLGKKNLERVLRKDHQRTMDLLMLLRFLIRD